MCKHVKLYLTNEYLSPFRAYRLCFLHPVSFVELNFKNYFRGFLSVRFWNAFFFYSYYLSNKGRKWVLICPLISQNSDCLTSLCSVCNEGAHRLLFLKLFCFATWRFRANKCVYFHVSADWCLDKLHCRRRALCLGSHLPVAFSLELTLHVGAIVLLCRVAPALVFLPSGCSAAH